MQSGTNQFYWFFDNKWPEFGKTKEDFADVAKFAHRINTINASLQFGILTKLNIVLFFHACYYFDT